MCTPETDVGQASPSFAVEARKRCQTWPTLHFALNRMSDNEPWLSILVPVHNGAAYLAQCLESIIDQAMSGIEIIVLDDASTDDPTSLVLPLQRRCAPGLRMISHPVNRGVAVARNHLLQEARGRYVWFIDADDMLRPGALQGLRTLLQTQSPDLVMCDFRVLREPARWKHRLRGEFHRHTFAGPARRTCHDRSVLVAGLLVRGQLHPWSKIAKREIWQSVRFPDARYFEDIAVMPQLIEKVRTYHYVPETWIAYRQHDASILARYSAEKMRHLIEALREVHCALPGPHGMLSEEATFSVQHFFLKSHASMARRIARGEFAQAAELTSLLRANLDAMFPAGVDPILRAYRRRGWLLRAMRARASLRRVGLYAAGARPSHRPS